MDNSVENQSMNMLNTVMLAKIVRKPEFAEAFNFLSKSLTNQTTTQAIFVKAHKLSSILPFPSNRSRTATQAIIKIQDIQTIKRHIFVLLRALFQRTIAACTSERRINTTPHTRKYSARRCEHCFGATPKYSQDTK